MTDCHWGYVFMDTLKLVFVGVTLNHECAHGWELFLAQLIFRNGQDWFGMLGLTRFRGRPLLCVPSCVTIIQDAFMILWWLWHIIWRIFRLTSYRLATIHVEQNIRMVALFVALEAHVCHAKRFRVLLSSVEGGVASMRCASNRHRL